MDIIDDLRESVTDPVKAVYLQIIKVAEAGSFIRQFLLVKLSSNKVCNFMCTASHPNSKTISRIPGNTC